MSFFREIGFIAYPLTLVLVLMLVQTGRGVVDVARAPEDGGGALRIHSILVLGVLAACLGVIGTLVGVYFTAAAIERAGEVSPSLAWGGMKVALGSSVVGFLVLVFGSIAWLILQYVRGRRESATP